VKNHPLFVPVETNQKDGMNLSSAKFSGFSKVQNLYITGHNNGAVNFWDASCPLFTPILQLKQQVIISSHDLKLIGKGIYKCRRKFNTKVHVIIFLIYFIRLNAEWKWLFIKWYTLDNTVLWYQLSSSCFRWPEWNGEVPSILYLIQCDSYLILIIYRMYLCIT